MAAEDYISDEHHDYDENFPERDYRRKKGMSRSGVVSKVYTRDWDGRDGPIVLHSFQLEGDRTYYRTGEEQIADEGDFLTFEADGKGNVDHASVEKGTAPPKKAASPQVPVQQSRSGGFKKGNWGNKGGGGAKDKYWEDKEKHQIEVVEPRITWASAQSDAVALVTAALQHDILSFGNANKAAKLGLLLDFVDQITARFATQRFNAASLLKDALALSEDENSESAGSEDNLDN